MNNQNSCLVITIIDESNATQLSYIPLNLSEEALAALLKIGSNCSNKIVPIFNIDDDIDTFWENVWDKLNQDD